MSCSGCTDIRVIGTGHVVNPCWLEFLPAGLLGCSRCGAMMGHTVWAMGCCSLLHWQISEVNTKSLRGLHLWIDE